MHLEIVCVGNELTREGRIFESVPLLVELLRKENVDVARISTLPDDQLPLRAGLEKLLHHADLVIALGGWHTHEIAAKIFESSQGKQKLLVLPEREEVIAGLWKGELGEKVRALFPNPKHRLRERIDFLLTEEQELRPLMKTWGKDYPGTKLDLSSHAGILTLTLEGDSKERLEALGCAIRATFLARTFYGRLEGAIQELCIKRKKRVAVAESCTGGAIAARLISLPGASDYFMGGVVAYDNALKERLLGVPREVLSQEGAVSAACVSAMVEGLFDKIPCDFALATSGIAGPSGGTREKPVGTVWGAIGERDKSIETFCLHIPGLRQGIIQRAVNEMLAHLWQLLAVD